MRVAVRDGATSAMSACDGVSRLAELERSALVVVLMHVHAVEHERVEVDDLPEGAVRALYGHHRARVGDRHAAEAELTLRSPAQRAVHLSHERAHDLGAELAVAAEQGAQAPRQRADPGRMGTRGRTLCSKWTAVSAIRRPRQEGQNPLLGSPAPPAWIPHGKPDADSPAPAARSEGTPRTPSPRSAAGRRALRRARGTSGQCASTV